MMARKDQNNSSYALAWLDITDVGASDWPYGYSAEHLEKNKHHFMRHQLFMVSLLPFMIASAITLDFDLTYIAKVYLGLSIFDVLVFCPHSHDAPFQIGKTQNIFLSLNGISKGCNSRNQKPTQGISDYEDLEYSEEMEFLVVPYTYVLLSKLRHRVATLRYLFNRE
ncbi:MAG: hypothetical protein ACFFER_09165 [Candidatus Thorarchaeota archaeon]